MQKYIELKLKPPYNIVLNGGGKLDKKNVAYR